MSFYLFVWFALDLRSLLTIDTILAHQAGLQRYVADHYSLAVILYCLTLVIHSMLALPATALLFMLSGILFGFHAGVIYAWIGSIIGGTIIFFITRSFLGIALHRRYGHLLAPFKKRIQDHACISLIIVRFIPIAPFCITNILAGLALIPFTTYLISLIIGIIPSVSLYVFIGTEMSHLTFVLALLNNPLFIIGCFMIFILSCALIHYLRYSSRLHVDH